MIYMNTQESIHKIFVLCFVPVLWYVLVDSRHVLILHGGLQVCLRGQQMIASIPVK